MSSEWRQDLMLSDQWTSEDIHVAEEAFDRVFPNGRGMGVWTARAETARDWAGTDKGLSTIDTRAQIKNHAEYKGMEVYAWQYFAGGMYADARDHFYAAALWRETDAHIIQQANPRHSIDEGHLKAIELCIRLGRFAGSLFDSQASDRGFRPAEDFGLKSSFVRSRENKAASQLDAFFD